MKVDLVVAGGARDPNVQSLMLRADALGLSALAIAFDPEQEPSLRWDPQTAELEIDGAAIAAKGAFIRFDVFTPPAEATPDSAEGSRDRATAWYTAVLGWAMVSGVRLFNRNHSQAAALKPLALHLAAEAGLDVPQTLISNRQDDVARDGGEGKIVKPVGGGAYTCHAKDLLDGTQWQDGKAPAPAFVQEALVYPEYRVYVVGDQILAFETYSDQLDFRRDQKPQTRFLSEGDLDAGLTERLKRMAHGIGLDFCAFDLKTRADTGALCFLEVNSSPMFTAFDALASGALSEAMVKVLTASE